MTPLERNGRATVEADVDISGCDGRELGEDVESGCVDGLGALVGKLVGGTLVGESTGTLVGETAGALVGGRVVGVSNEGTHSCVGTCDANWQLQRTYSPFRLVNNMVSPSLAHRTFPVWSTN